MGEEGKGEEEKDVFTNVTWIADHDLGGVRLSIESPQGQLLVHETMIGDIFEHTAISDGYLSQILCSHSISWTLELVMLHFFMIRICQEAGNVSLAPRWSLAPWSL